MGDVLTAKDLARRPSRAPDFEAESQALGALARQMAASPETILQRLADVILPLCRAESSGVSILERDGAAEVFRWHVVSGRFADNAGGTMPLADSPCGTVISRDSALLFHAPVKHFPELAKSLPPISEALLVPFHIGGRPTGTVWALHHADDRAFDAEDLRLLTSLSRFAGAAYQIQSALGSANEAREQFRQSNEALRASEARFRHFIEAVKDYAIFVMDPAGNVSSWNEGARRTLGYTAEEILGCSSRRFFTPEDLHDGLFERELATASAEGRAIDENWLVRKDGTRFWASGVSTVLRDDGGVVTGFIKILRDLTESKQIEDSLHENERRLRVALSAARMGTWHWDIPADVQSIDESLSALVGLTPDQRSGRLDEFLAVVHAEDREHVREAFVASIDAGRELDVEFRVVWPDGSVRYLKDQGEVFYDNEGRPLYMAGACVDVTERKLAEMEKTRLLELERDARAASERASRLKD